jgi:hypothetical protein
MPDERDRQSVAALVAATFPALSAPEIGTAVGLESP